MSFAVFSTIIVIFSIALALGLNIYDKCSSHDICPEHATCQPSSCDGFTCRCNEGYVANTDLTQCLQAKRIGERCDWFSTRCISPFSTCLGTCQCFDVFVPTHDGRCRLPGTGFVSEACENDKCEVPSKCINGFCQCEDPYRSLTKEEFWVDPLDAIQCRKIGYSLHECNGTKMEIPVSLARTSSTTPTATTTTTTAVLPTTTALPPTTTNVDARKFQLVYEPCGHPDECPPHSTCKPNSCEGYTCLCKHGYISNDAHTECLKSTRIGEVCDWHTSKCLSPFAMCLGVCSCYDVFLPTKDGRCRLPDFSYLHDSCGPDVMCEYPAKCIDGHCQCVEPFRELTVDEFWIDPTNMLQCREINYSLST